MKARIRKTGEIVDVISYNTCSTIRSHQDYVSYIDSKGEEHDRESLNYYWDFDLDSFLTDSLTYDPNKRFIKNQTIKCEMFNGLANPNGEKVAQKMIIGQSPHNLIKNCKDRCKPILIIHGKEDSRVP